MPLLIGDRAFPVRITQLGAHLEVHKSMKPQRDTLRLCHRFGIGNNVHVTKLPIELLDKIEAAMLEDDQLIASASWESSIACFEESCRPTDHLFPSEIQELKIRLRNNGNDDRDLEDIPDDDEALQPLVHTSSTRETHYENQHGWLGLIREKMFPESGADGLEQVGSAVTTSVLANDQSRRSRILVSKLSS